MLVWAIYLGEFGDFIHLKVQYNEIIRQVTAIILCCWGCVQLAYPGSTPT